MAAHPRPAHEAVWFQKWRIHPQPASGGVRRPRAQPPDRRVCLSPACGRAALKGCSRAFDRYGTYLCAQAYPDGAPTHCAYPSGHSVGAGATITMLKAIFDERFVIPNPEEPSADGLRLQDYDGPPLTVGGELSKLAFNIGMARVMAGIH